MKSITVVKVGSLRDPDELKRGQVRVMDIPIQPLGPEDVRIKVAYCAICGSDPHLVENIFGWEVPFGLGHEVSGVIVELRSKATKKGLKISDRVAGNFLRFCRDMLSARTASSSSASTPTNPQPRHERIRRLA